MLLDDAKNYTFMTAGGLKVPGIDDVEEFASTQNSMKVMGISDEDMTSIWRIISSCLLFGNMEFKQDRNGDQASLPDNTVAQKVAHLLGIQVTDLTKAFLKPRIKGVWPSCFNYSFNRLIISSWPRLCDQGPEQGTGGVRCGGH